MPARRSYFQRTFCRMRKRCAIACGVIAGGKLRGVGALRDRSSGVKSPQQWKLYFELAESAVNAQQILAKATKSGANYRMSVIEGELYAALGGAARSGRQNSFGDADQA